MAPYFNNSAGCQQLIALTSPIRLYALLDPLSVYDSARSFIRGANVVSYLPDNYLALYADLLQKADLPVSPPFGSFVSKTIQGKVYWYHQTDTVAGRKQEYLGQESAELLEQIAARRAAIKQTRTFQTERKRLVAMMGSAGAHLEKGRAARIISKLSDAGLFSAGGVMVGSFAFACYGNMLGVKTAQTLTRTEDIDFSLARTIDIAFKRDMKAVLLNAEPTLRAPMQINPRIIPFEMVAPDGFKVEFLTTQESVHEISPVSIDRFSVYAQPLAFMDYLLTDPQKAVVLNGAGIPVSIPNPAHFALHKLAVSQLRPVGTQAKIMKDLNQASALIQILSRDNPGALIFAVDAAFGRTDGFPYFVQKSLARLDATSRAALFESYGDEFPNVALDTATGRFTPT